MGAERDSAIFGQPHTQFCIPDCLRFLYPIFWQVEADRGRGTDSPRLIKSRAIQPFPGPWYPTWLVFGDHRSRSSRIDMPLGYFLRSDGNLLFGV